MSMHSWKLPEFAETKKEMSEIVKVSENGTFSMLPNVHMPVTVHDRQSQVSDQLLLLSCANHPRVQLEDTADVLITGQLTKNTTNTTTSIQVQCDLEGGQGLLPYVTLSPQDRLCQLFRGITGENMTHIMSQTDSNIDLAVSVLLDCGFLYTLDNSLQLKLEMHQNPSEASDLDIKDNSVDENSTSTSGIGSESETGSAEDEETIVMEFGHELAQCMQNLFGPVDNQGMPAAFMSADKLRARIPTSLVAQLHAHWVETQKCGIVARNGFTVDCDTSSPISLHAQMLQDEAIARELAACDFVFDASQFPNLKPDPNSMATRLKLKELKETYTSVDPQLLSDIFEQNRYNSNDTKFYLTQTGHFPSCNPSPSSNIYDPMSVEALSGDEIDADYSSMTYDDMRKEARNFAYNKRLNFEKAQKYFRDGQKEVASYYSQLGRDFYSKEKAANAQVAANLLSKRENDTTLDLHGLHVNEALCALNNFLRKNDRVGPIHSGCGKQLKIITGVGKHSINGPKIKPSVIASLKQWKYRFEEMSGGTLKVWAK